MLNDSSEVTLPSSFSRQAMMNGSELSPVQLAHPVVKNAVHVLQSRPLGFGQAENVPGNGQSGEACIKDKRTIACLVGQFGRNYAHHPVSLPIADYRVGSPLGAKGLEGETTWNGLANGAPGHTMHDRVGDEHGHFTSGGAAMFFP